MGFDHRVAYADDLQEKYSQQGEAGPNHNNDCVPATFSNILHAYGYRHTQPKWWDAGEYPAGYLGPTSYAAMVDFMRLPTSEFPNPPDVRISNPVDTLGAVEGAGAAGFAVAFNGWSDGAGNYQTHATGILHVGAVMAHLADADGEYVIVLNPEHNTPQRFGAADFRAITSGAQAGWLAIFARPLPLPVPASPPVPPVVPVTPQPPVVPPVASEPDYKALWQAGVVQLDQLKADLQASGAIVSADLVTITDFRNQLALSQAALAAVTKERDEWKTKANTPIYVLPGKLVPPPVTTATEPWWVSLGKAIFGPR